MSKKQAGKIAKEANRMGFETKLVRWSMGSYSVDITSDATIRIDNLEQWQARKDTIEHTRILREINNILA